MAKGDQYSNNPQGFRQFTLDKYNQGLGQSLPENIKPQIGGWLREILQGRIFPPFQPNQPVVPQPNQPNIPYNTPDVRMPQTQRPFPFNSNPGDRHTMFDTNRGIWG